MNEQKNLTISYVVIEEPNRKPKLLVSVPGGKVLELLITPDIAEGLDDTLGHSPLWEVFFKSLIGSEWVDEDEPKAETK